MISKLALLFAATLVVTSAASARGSLDVCSMTTTELPRSISETSKSNYLRRIAVECEISKKYQHLKSKARQNWDLSLENIAEYQAMRYIRRVDFEAGKQNGTPVELLYQVFKANYMKPNSEKSSVVWNGFIIGVEQLEPERQRLTVGGRLDISDIERYHRGFYRLSTEEGDHAHNPHPGILKAPGLSDYHWWKLKPNDVESTRRSVDRMNSAFAEMGLLPSGAERSKFEPHVRDVLSVRSTADGSAMGIYSGDTRANRRHLERTRDFLNHVFTQARRGEHMVWNDRLFTPAEVAFAAQQFFVAIHPFHEGNGRISRFIQELVLVAFNMPHGSSGDMMEDDVLMAPDEYYQIGIRSLQTLLSSVDRCLEKTYVDAAARSRTRPASLLEIPDDRIEYGCRILR